MPLRKRPIGLAGLIFCLFVYLAGISTNAAAEQIELRIGYINNPIQEASVAMLEKWANAHGIKLVKVQMSYAVFQQKVTASLTSGGDQFDIIWHNDDWGQLWKKWLEPMDDVPDMNKTVKSSKTIRANKRKAKLKAKRRRQRARATA